MFKHTTDKKTWFEVILTKSIYFPPMWNCLIRYNILSYLNMIFTQGAICSHVYDVILIRRGVQDGQRWRRSLDAATAADVITDGGNPRKEWSEWENSRNH